MCLIFLLSLEREKGKREKHWWDRSNNGLPLTGLPLGMELETPGMCPDHKLKWRPLSAWNDARPMEPHRVMPFLSQLQFLNIFLIYNRCWLHEKWSLQVILISPLLLGHGTSHMVTKKVSLVQKGMLQFQLESKSFLAPSNSVTIHPSVRNHWSSPHVSEKTEKTTPQSPSLAVHNHSEEEQEAEH